MTDESQGLEFALYVWRRRGLIFTILFTALTLTGVVSLILTRQYTATASVLIEPPAGNDPRASLALSQVYLDSLKTYEQFASGDTLFSGALDELHLRAQYAGTSVETLKRRILAVSRPTNATYIQIAATLPNAKDAQKLAQYIAERAVALNNSVDEESNTAMVQEPQRILAAAKTRRDSVERAAAQLAKRGSLEALQKEYNSAAELRTAVGRDLTLARADLANYTGQLQAPSPITPDIGTSPDGSRNTTDGAESQSAWIQYEISASVSRVHELEDQERKLLAYLNEKGSALEELQRTSESLGAELKSARADEGTAQSRLGEIEISAPFRGVRLKILDPGIVPERPSFPNIPLNMVVAFIGSIILATGYLAIRFAHERVRFRQYSWR
jgi:capsular polysaccharide biosynthesis protein